MMSLERLHRLMGHISYDAVKMLVRKGLISGVKVDLGTPTPFCETCLYAKGKQKSILKERANGKCLHFGDMIHSDIWGPSPVTSQGGKDYYVSFTDDATHLTTVYLLRLKSDVFTSYKQYDTWVENQMKARIKILMSDQGGEYLGKEFIKYLLDRGTEHRLTIHDTPEQNGVAE